MAPVSDPQPSTYEPRTFRMGCPYCQEPIFFYRAADGGCAFFDELGSPWPKHACFDNRITTGNARARMTTVAPSGATKPSYPNRKWPGGYAVEVLTSLALETGGRLLLLHVVDHDLMLPMVTDAKAPATLTSGHFYPGDKAGMGTFRPRSDGGEFSVFGPAFGCWDGSVWSTRKGAPDRLAELARDLSINRFHAFGGDPFLRFVAPRWKDAFALFMDGLEQDDDSLLAEVMELLEGHGREVFGPAFRANTLRSYGLYQRANKKADRGRIKLEILEAFAGQVPSLT